MSLNITILGCGGSAGVPAIGNHWGNCDPAEPRNRRTRCSLAVQSDKTTIVIDTSPELNHQTALFDITNIDSVFYSHQHSDHSHGIHDMRSMFFRNGHHTIPCYGSAAALTEIKHRFDFMFSGGNHADLYPPVLTTHNYDDDQYGNLQKFKDIEYIPFEMDHGTCKTVGYRFGELSYCVDMKYMDDKALECVKGSKIWIVDGCGYDNAENPVHADLETLYRYNEIVGAYEVYVTSLSPLMDYRAMLRELPEGFYPAYDGLRFKQ